MKITIEPTNDKNYPTCSVSVESDDLSLDDAFNKLIIPALLGWGYCQETIDKYLSNLD